MKYTVPIVLVAIIVILVAYGFCSGRLVWQTPATTVATVSAPVTSSVATAPAPIAPAVTAPVPAPVVDDATKKQVADLSTQFASLSADVCKLTKAVGDLTANEQAPKVQLTLRPAPIAQPAPQAPVTDSLPPPPDVSGPTIQDGPGAMSQSVQPSGPPDQGQEDASNPVTGQDPRLQDAYPQGYDHGNGVLTPHATPEETPIVRPGPKMLVSTNGTRIPASAILTWCRNQRTHEVRWYWTATQVDGRLVPVTLEQSNGQVFPISRSGITAAIYIGQPPVGFVDPGHGVWDGHKFASFTQDQQ